ncbi:amidohydrolase [Paludisphaera borealis]|uniref:Putative hydrolase YxeP n=1 Tax=Paludisphaera borealis TaxID=1387353 RepID=A0A1U7CY18_9BACT|nr:amidohydrolase [Paludisphaera borealis]APW63842.1 putative hydrolase YxeP [Paludisphaera borealis]
MSRWLLTLLIAATACGRSRAADPPAPALSPIETWISERQEQLQRLYTDLHAHPELSFQEVETSRRIADELRKAGAKVTTGVGKLGVVGVIENGPGPVVLVRSDMDALPVTERTGLPYASQAKATDPLGRVVGVMHACGHDVHMTCLVGTANWLAEHKGDWSGTVVLIAQPAEETIGGARKMLDDGLYQRFPKPDFALALHCKADSPVGDVLYRPGPMLASSTSLNVTIRGKGGHGAMPHRTVDPIVLAALAILDFQTIVSREIEPIQPAVVTVGSIHGGEKHNIISDEVKLQLTLRSYSETVRLQLIEGIERRAKALAVAHKAPPPSVEVQEHTPATINRPELVARVTPFLKKALGDGHVQLVDPVMGAEDFALYAEGDVPIMMFWIGTVPPQRIEEAISKGVDLPGLHSSLYHPEPAGSIATGVRAMTAAVSGLLPPKPKP